MNAQLLRHGAAVNERWAGFGGGVKQVGTFRQSALVAVASFSLFFMSLAELVSEYRAASLLCGTTNDQLLIFADSRLELPESSAARTIRDILSTCGRLLTVSPRLKADPVLTDLIRQQCNRIGKEYLTRSPSNGRAMAVVLLTGDAVDPNRLAQAQAAAPWEPWALNLRLRAVARLGPPSAEVEPAFAADLKRALMADWGQAVVADLYAANAGLRPAITRAAETASAAAQRAFLEKLRSREGGA